MIAPKGLIFDLDGTLADTKLDFPKICREAGVAPGTPLLEYCESLDDKVRASEIHQIIERHEMEGAHQSSWIGDAENMLQFLTALQIPLAIVTRNMRAAVSITIEKLRIPIELVITREDCLPKPHPEGLLKIAKQWQIAPQELAYVGDYKFDLMAAKNAGMHAILLSTERNIEFHTMADWVIDDFSEISAMYSSYNF